MRLPRLPLTKVKRQARNDRKRKLFAMTGKRVACNGKIRKEPLVNLK